MANITVSNDIHSFLQAEDFAAAKSLLGILAGANKLDATAAPTVNDDSADTSGNGAFEIGSLWVDVNANPREAYRCLDATATAAVWVNTTLDTAELAAVAVSGSAADLSGTLDSARIADGSLSLAKLASTVVEPTDIGSTVQAYDDLLSDIAGLTVSGGDILYVNGSGDIVNLGKGSDGQVLTLASGLPSWAATSGGGGGGAFDWSVRNESGATLTKGTAVYFSSYDSGDSLALIDAADGATASTSRTMGLVKADIANNANGEIVTEGELSGLDTSTWSERTVLYATTSGALTSVVQPYSRAVGIVIYSHASSGIIYVYPHSPTFQTGTEGAGARTLLLNTSLAAAETELVITLNFDYWDYFEVEFFDFKPSYNTAKFNIEFQNGGSVVTGTYRVGWYYLNTVSGANGDTLGTNTDFTNWSSNLGSGAGEGVIECKMEFHPNTSGQIITSNFRRFVEDGSGSYFSQWGNLHLPTTSDYDAVRFWANLGNIASGSNYRVWGIKA